MRSRLLPTSLLTAALLAAAVPAATPAAASDTPPPGAQARADALAVQIAVQQSQLTRLDAQLTADQQQEDQLAGQLAEMARLGYESRGVGLVQMLRAGSVVELWNRYSQARLVSHRQREARDRMSQLKQRDAQARAQVRSTLASLDNERIQALAAAAAERRAALLAQIAAAQATARPSGGGNHFTYGYCTWYVANKRYVPWFGNAIEWWPNARAYGYAEGQQPQVGAIMVTRESSSGHVAYVESVNGDGSWTVSEMNFVGWGVVSRRTIRPGQVPLVGFIY